MDDQALVRFRCDIEGDRNASRLCLNGGTCQVASSALEFCVCPPGFVHDYTYQHFPNCGMSDFAVPVMFGVITSFTIFALGMTTLMYMESRSHVKVLFVYMTLQVICNWIFYLSMWLEAGNYQASAVFLVLSNVSNNRVVGYNIRMLAAPLHGMFKSSLQQLNRGLFVGELFGVVSGIIFAILAIIWSRDTDPARFNTLMVIYLFVIILAMVVLIISAYSVSSRLRQTVEASIASGASDPQLARFSGKLKQIVEMCFGCAFMCAFLFVMPIVSVILGSFPGQYIVVFAIHLVQPLSTIQMAFAMRWQGMNSAGSSLQNTAAVSQTAIGPIANKRVAGGTKDDNSKVVTYASHDT